MSEQQQRLQMPEPGRVCKHLWISPPSGPEADSSTRGVDQAARSDRNNQVLGRGWGSGAWVPRLTPDIYVLIRYGFLVWLIILPIALTLAWFCIAMTALLVGVAFSGLVRLVGWLLGICRPSSRDMDNDEAGG